VLDYRYHISSIIAVFLALGLGIFVGSTLDGEHVLVREQQQMIIQLEQEFRGLREQVRSTRQEADYYREWVGRYQQFVQSIFPRLVDGKLSGKRIAVVRTVMAGDVGDVVGALKLAGASVESVTLLTGPLNLPDQAVMADLAGLLGWTGPVNPGQLAAQLGSILAEVVHSADARPVVDLLIDVGLIKVSGRYGVPLDAVVLVGGSSIERENYFRLLDLPMIRRFREAGIEVIGSEFSTSPCSYIKYYQAHQLSTIDNIETILGQTALVLALTGQQGHFGIKNTAQSILPLEALWEDPSQEKR